MPTNCECDDIVVEDCPPYLTVETFNNYAEMLCANCTATDTTTGTTSMEASEYLSYFELDSCCPVLTVYKGNQILYSFDGGATWVETGTALVTATTTLGSTTFTNGVIATPLINSGNTVFNIRQRNFLQFNSPENNRFKLAESGYYMMNFDLQVTYNVASSTHILFEYMENNTPIGQRQATTRVFNGVSPTEIGSTRQMRVNLLRKITAPVDVNFRFYTGISTFTSNLTFIHTYITKLSGSGV
jgi:hypothetical protein